MDTLHSSPFAQSLPAARTEYSFFSPSFTVDEEKVPTNQPLPNYSLSVGINDNNDFAAFLPHSGQQENVSDNSVASLFIGLRTKSLNDSSHDSKRRIDIFSKSTIAKNSVLSSTSVATDMPNIVQEGVLLEDPLQLSRSRTHSDGQALTLEALERTPDRNAFEPPEKESWTTMMPVAAPDLLETSTQTAPDLFMEDISLLVDKKLANDAQIDQQRPTSLKETAPVIGSVEFTKSYSGKESARQFIKDIVLGLMSVAETIAVSSEAPITAALSFQDAEMQTATALVHSIDTQTELLSVPIPSTAKDVTLSINSGTQTLSSLFVDAAVQVELTRRLFEDKAVATVQETPVTLAPPSTTISTSDYAGQKDAVRSPTADEMVAAALPFLTTDSRLEDVVLKVLKREWLQHEKKIR